MLILPSQWRPTQVGDLIGESLRVGKILSSKITRISDNPEARFKALFYGPPGTGKTSLAAILARMLAADPIALDATCGQDVTIDTVRSWEADMGMRPMFGDWQVKLVNEVDTMPSAAQLRLLDYLDKLPPRYAFIGTSNVDIDGLAERFQTRLQPWKIEGPSTEQIIAFLQHRWPELPLTEVKAIAVGSGGNVRAACLDAESALDVLLAA